MDAKLAVKLLIEDKEALGRLKTAFDKMESDGKRSAGGIAGGWTELAAKFYLVQQAIRPVIDFMSGAVAAAMEQEDAINRLNVALKNQGTFTAELSLQYQKMASDLQSSTRFADEAISTVQQRLVAIGDVAPEEMGRATQAVLDFATATGTDLEAAATLFAKAAAGNTSALSRYGIVLDESIPKSERFNALLDVVAQKMGGAAQADVNTYAGATAQLGNAWGEMLEELGNLVVKNPDVIKSIQNMKDGIIGLTQYVKDHAAAWSESISVTLRSIDEYTKKLKELETKQDINFNFNVAGMTGGAGEMATQFLQQFYEQKEAYRQEDAAREVETAQMTADQVRMIQDQQELYDEDKRQREMASALGVEEIKLQTVLQSTQIAQQLKNQALQTELKSELEALKQKGKLSETELNYKLALEQALVKAKTSGEKSRYDATVAFGAAAASAVGAVAQISGKSSLKSVAVVIDAVMQSIAVVAESIAQFGPILGGIIGAIRATAIAAQAAAALQTVKEAENELDQIGQMDFSKLSSNLNTFSSSIGSLPSLGGLKLPGAASGGDVLSPGFVRVGERGEETVFLPQGAKVRPSDSGFGGQVYIHIEIHNPTGRIDEELLNAIEERMSDFIYANYRRL